MRDDRVINLRQLGGMDRYVIDDGAGRGVRAVCFETGAGLNFRVLVDRGLDIDLASFNGRSLAFLTQKGVIAPTRGLDRGSDWLGGFAGGLLTSCGPFSIGAPSDVDGVHYGLHGPHSHTPAELIEASGPDDDTGAMRLVGRMRYGAFYGPSLELVRTLTTRLGSNRVDVCDVFTNVGNTPSPHAWLLHVNFGFPLLDEGAMFGYRASRVLPRDDERSRLRFGQADYRRFPAPSQEECGSVHGFAYLDAIADADGKVRCGVGNAKLGFGLEIVYDPKQFPRLGNWQHFGPGEYVAALEPMNGGVEGRATDVKLGRADTMEPGSKRRYDYSLAVVEGAELSSLLARV
jgi:hypothetical protein